MEDLEDLLWVFAGLIIGAVVLAKAIADKAFSKRQAKRRLAAGSSELVDGAHVRLVGKVRALETIEGPLSGRPGVAYEASAQLFDEDLAVDQTFREKLVQSGMVSFELVTRDTTVLVEGTSLDIALPSAPIIPRRLEREIAFLDAHARSREYVRRGVFEEVVVGDGDRIAVSGTAIIEARIRLVARDDHPITIGKP